MLPFIRALTGVLICFFVVLCVTRMVVTVEMVLHPVWHAGLRITVEIGNVGLDIEYRCAVQRIQALYDNLARVNGEM